MDVEITPNLRLIGAIMGDTYKYTGEVIFYNKVQQIYSGENNMTIIDLNFSPLSYLVSLFEGDTSYYEVFSDRQTAESLCYRFQDEGKDCFVETINALTHDLKVEGWVLGLPKT